MRGRTDRRSQRIREVVVRLSLLATYISIYTHKVSLTWLPKHELNKDDTNKPANWMERNSQCLNPTKKSRQPSKAGSRRGGSPQRRDRKGSPPQGEDRRGGPPREKIEEVVLPRKEHTHWLSTVKRSAMKTYIQVTYGLNRLCFGIYIVVVWICLAQGMALLGSVALLEEVCHRGARLWDLPPSCPRDSFSGL